MNDDSLKKWALVAEICGGIGVIVSLIFVGLQIRQSSVESNLNTRALEVSAYQELTGQINAVGFHAMTNPEFSEFIWSVFRNEIQVTDPLPPQVISYLNYTIRHSDTSYFQYAQGLINAEQLHSMFVPLRAQLRVDVGKAHWDSGKNSYPAEFVDYVENHMKADRPEDEFWSRK